MLSVSKKTLVLAMMALPLTMSTATWAAEDNNYLVKRIERLERIIKGQGLVSLLSRVDQLQNQVKQLNGDNEALRHQIEQLKKRNKQLYIDLDDRLQKQEDKLAQAATIAAAPQVTTRPSVTMEQPTTPAVAPTAAKATVKAPEVKQPVTPADNKPVAVENGEAAYQAALQTLRSGQYEQAVAAFTAFPEKYPHSSYLPNAYYWRGEAHLVLAQFEKAIESFQTVIDQFPDSRKMPDATLKKGFALFSLGKVKESKATLTSVIQQYPNSSAARLAKVKLERIKQAN
jgi:tol-pal system protein YbgF